MLWIFGLGFLMLAAVFAVAIVMALRGGEGPAGRFELSRVIADAMAAIGRVPLSMAGLALATAGAPMFLVVAAAAGTPMLVDAGASLSIGIAGLVLGFGWYQFGTLAMIAATLAAIDRRPAPGAVLASALPAVPAAMVASVLYWLAVGAGFMFMVVPGAIVACVWMLVLPVIVAERAGPFAALSRSARLTRGIRWQLFLIAVIGFIFGLVVQSMLGGLAALLGGGWAAQIGFALASSLLSMFPPAIVASAYRLAVTVREGPSTRELEQVFA